MDNTTSAITPVVAAFDQSEQASPDRSGNLLPFFALDGCPPWQLISLMPIDTIRVYPNGHGELIDLDGLAASIRERGVLQPLVVAPDGRLLAGRRRLEAAKRAGLNMVPVRICEIASERAAVEIGLIENIERTDPDPVTRARCYRALIERGATVGEIATLVGEDDGHVYQHLALLDLHLSVQQAVETRTLAFADARTFAKLPSEDQATVLTAVMASVRNLDGKPMPSRQIKMRVDTQRVLRLAQRPARQERTGEPTALHGNYAALFERDENTEASTPIGRPTDPLDELNALIAEMIRTAQDEDQIRGWARRLSHILKDLKATRAAQAPKIVQERLL